MNARDRDALAAETLTDFCLPLVRRVREDDPEEWGAWLAQIPADRVRVMAALLAALVPVDETVTDLTAWMHIDTAALPDTATEGAGGELIDLIAVERALTGHEPVGLTAAEKRAATRIGTVRGMSAAELAKRLDVTARSVQRYRKAAAA
mgnify:CR=1 FL=1